MCSCVFPLVSVLGILDVSPHGFNAIHHTALYMFMCAHVHICVCIHRPAPVTQPLPLRPCPATCADNMKGCISKGYSEEQCLAYAAQGYLCRVTTGGTFGQSPLGAPTSCAAVMQAEGTLAARSSGAVQPNSSMCPPNASNGGGGGGAWLMCVCVCARVCTCLRARVCRIGKKQALKCDANALVPDDPDNQCPDVQTYTTYATQHPHHACLFFSWAVSLCVCLYVCFVFT